MVLTPDWDHWDSLERALAAINANQTINCRQTVPYKRADTVVRFRNGTSTCLTYLPDGTHIVAFGPNGRHTAKIRVYTTAFGKKTAIKQV